LAYYGKTITNSLSLKPLMYKGRESHTTSQPLCHLRCDVYVKTQKVKGQRHN